MIIKDEVNEVFRVGVISGTSFKIKSSAKAFKLLSSGVYTDKPTAIMRELSCNAKDIHSTVHKEDVPFLIHLPNDFEPYFSIRDYGTGISPEDMETVYTTYFESTKTQSNNDVGCFGIGGKSPYSYTDNYSVTSIYKGEKRVYSAYLNEAGEPDLAELSNEKTDEPDGLEVSFAVASKDFYTFISKLPNVLKYFTVKPIVVGAEIVIPEIKYKFKRDNWGVLDGSQSFNNAKAIMGSVCYPLYDYAGTDLTPSEKALLNLNLDVFFPIGALDVALSRENLSYDEPTKKNIKETLEKIVKELREEIEKEIASCKTLWDAKLFYNELKSGKYANFKDVLKDMAFEWNGTKIVDNMVDLKVASDVEYHIYAEADSYRRRRTKYYGEYKHDEVVFANDRVLFVVNDLKVRGVKPRLEKYLREIKRNAVIVVLKEKVKDGIKLFKEQIGMASDYVFTNVSTMPIDPLEAGQEGFNPKSKVSILRYEGIHTSTPSAPWVAEEIDLTLGGVYINIHHYAEVTSHIPANEYVKTQLRLLTNIRVDLPVVYGVKPKALDSVTTLSNWKTLKDYVHQEYLNYSKVNNLQDRYTMHLAHSQFLHDASNKFGGMDLVEKVSNLFRECRTQMEASGKYTAVIQHLDAIRKFTGVEEEVFTLAGNDASMRNETIYQTIYKEFDDVFTTIIQKAPMLSYVRAWQLGEAKAQEYLVSTGVI